MTRRKKKKRDLGQAGVRLHMKDSVWAVSGGTKTVMNGRIWRGGVICGVACRGPGLSVAAQVTPQYRSSRGGKREEW